MSHPPLTRLRVASASIALFVLAASCVSFPEVTGGAAAGGGGSGAGTSSNTGTGAGNSVSSSSAGGGLGVCEDAPGTGGGDPFPCLNEESANTGNQATISNSGSDLLITPSNGFAWWQNDEGDFLRTGVSGSFVALTQVTVAGSNESPAFEVGGLLVRDSSGAWVKFEAGRIAPAVGPRQGMTIPGVLLAHRDEVASQHLGMLSDPYYYELATPGPVWLGLCRDITEGFAFFYRIDSTWEEHDVRPILASRTGGGPAELGPFSEAVDVGLIAGDYQDTTPNTVATFRGFRVEPLEVQLMDCTGALDQLVDSVPPHCGFCVD